MSIERVKQPAVDSIDGADAVNRRFKASRADVTDVNRLRQQEVTEFVRSVNRAYQIDDAFFASIGSDEVSLSLASKVLEMAAERHEPSMIQALSKLVSYFDTVQLGRDMQRLLAQHLHAHMAMAR